jgi:hypothetical protein
MKPGLLTFRTNQVQKLLDYGLSVTVDGTEFFQVHKLFMRATVQNDGVIVGYKALEAPSSRLYLMDRVSKMTDEEFMTVSSTLAMNEQLKKIKPVMEMVREAIEIHEKFSSRPVMIGSHLNEAGDEVKIRPPLIGHIVKQRGELPFTLSIEDLETQGARIERIQTIWKFAPNNDPKALLDVLGSEHSVHQEHGVAPKIRTQKEPEAGFSPN